MATIVAAAGGGNWTAGATWVGGVAPTAADDARLDASSGNVTIDAGAVARSLDCTGYTGTLTHNASTTLTLGDATAGAGNVALKLVAGMTYTLGNTSTSAYNFVSTSTTQQTITTAGKALGSMQISNAGSSYILGDALLTNTSSTFVLVGGTFNTGNFAMSIGLLAITGASAKTLTLGSSAVEIRGNSGTALLYSGSNLTVTANTAVVTFSGATAGISGTAANWNGLSLVYASTVTAARVETSSTFNNVTYTSGAVKTSTLTINAVGAVIAGTLTVTGNSTVNRILMASNAAGTARTVTVGTGFSFSNVDFSDITAAGAAGTWTGTSMGDALGNTNITFDTPTTQTRTGAGGNWSDAGNWTSRVPLPQDNVVVGAGASGTITADMPRLGADVDFTGFTGTCSGFVAGATCFGSITLATGMTFTASVTLIFSGRSTHTITSNGKSFHSVRIDAPGGTYTLQDDLTTTSGASSFNQLRGGFNDNSKTVTTFNVDLNNTGVRTLTMTGIWNIQATGSSSIWVANPSGLTLNAAGSTINIAVASASTRTFEGGGKTYGTLTYTLAGSTGHLAITGSNTFDTINFSDANNARSLRFTAGTTTTVRVFNVFGTAGKLMTVDSLTAANHTLVKTSGMVVSDYLNISRSQASGGAKWYAGANSTDVGNNSGWVFAGVSSPLLQPFLALLNSPIDRDAISGAGLPASEDILLNALTSFAGSVTGSTNDNAGAIAVLGDGSDATYVQGVDDEGFWLVQLAGAGFAGLQSAGGRNVASFTVTMRCSSSTATGSASINTITGTGTAPTPTNDAESVTTGGSIQDKVLGPFTPNGGGSWTEAQINALLCQLFLDSSFTPSTLRIYRIWLTVTYA